MSPDGGFTDLRLNRQEGMNQESFWPSFTDIMTVIVMIFMVSFVVLLMRNIELVNQLRATMEAERTAQELARTTGEQKENLALKLIATENELSMLRIRLMQMDEQSKSQISTIGTQTEDIATLEATKKALTLRQNQLVAENYTLGQRLKRASTTINSQQQNLETLQQNLDSTQQQLAGSQQQLINSQQQLSNAQQQVENSQQQLAAVQVDLASLEQEHESVQQQLTSLQATYGLQSLELLELKTTERRFGRQINTLQGEFDDLKLKYNKLIRPARSPEGHYLVEVRYTKSAGRLVIEYQTEDKPGYSAVSQTVLENQLDKLMKIRKEGLYIKLIFPEKSGLSFNEAWQFTSRLQGKYDYYSQEGADDLVPVDIQGE